MKSISDVLDFRDDSMGLSIFTKPTTTTKAAQMFIQLREILSNCSPRSGKFVARSHLLILGQLSRQLILHLLAMFHNLFTANYENILSAFHTRFEVLIEIISDMELWRQSLAQRYVELA